VVENVQRLLMAGVAVVGLFLYLIPTYVAGQKRHPRTLDIATLNVLLGWTFVGWWLALAWALTDVKKRREGVGP
jgi:hypothetical protein